MIGMIVEFNDCKDCPYSNFQGISEPDYVICMKRRKVGRVENIFKECPLNDYGLDEGDEHTTNGALKNSVYPSLFSPLLTGSLNHIEFIKSNQRYCERCGALNNKSQKYCGECGYRMRSMDGSDDFYCTSKESKHKEAGCGDGDEMYWCRSCQYFYHNIRWNGVKGECEKNHRMKVEFKKDALEYSKINCPSYKSNSEKFDVKYEEEIFALKILVFLIFIIFVLLRLVGD